MKRAVSYFDVVGRAVGHLDGRDVARAVERLSRTYREGRDVFDYDSDAGRAAYLWHVFPAHVCDLSRLFLDLAGELLLPRRRVRLVGLGAGPGTEAVALLHALTALRSQGELAQLEAVEVVRVDRSPAWDAAFGVVLAAARDALRARDPGLGSAWALEAARTSLACDLTQAPLPRAVREALARADLVVAANLLTEVGPRGTDELPAGLRATLAEAVATLPRGADLVVLDRAGAPGAAGRLRALRDLAREAGLTATEPRERQTRCGCAVTRRARAIYRDVHLPTTKDQDSPVLNCRTLWFHARRAS